jgi:2-oxoglutarate dehydrogenase E2 component (dihydrolipoamide succinyltransferase)
MVEALQTAAMLTTFNEVDMSQVIAIREKYKEAFLEEHGVKLGFMSFFVKAVCSALKQFPLLNSYIDGDEIVERLYYNLGVAVGTDKGVFVPVIKNCETLSFSQIEKAIVGLSKKAKEGSIEIGDLQGGGFTITNGGIYGSLLSTPILNPPQSGILGMHKIVKRPIAVEDTVEIRPMMYLALSYDHRIVDGKEAVSFLVHIKNHLEDPSLELLDL